MSFRASLHQVGRTSMLSAPTTSSPAPRSASRTSSPSPPCSAASSCTRATRRR